MFKILIKKLSQVIPSTPYPLITRVESIAEMKKFTLEDCKSEIVYNWQNKKLNFLSGIKVSEEELDMLLKVADCLKPEELQEDMISPKVKKEICKVLNCNMWEVNKFVILHKTHKRMHEYLIARLIRKEFLPKTEEEIKKMMLQDPMPRTKTSLFISKRRDKVSRKQMKFSYHKRQGSYSKIN